MTRPVSQHGRGVLDTNTVIVLSRITDATALPSEPLITAVALAELSVGPLVASTGAERAARQAHLQQAEADFDPLPLTPQPHGPSAEWPHRCVKPVERSQRAPTTR